MEVMRNDQASRAAVDHPLHYTYGRIECWDAIAAWGLDFFAGNVVKYVVRAQHKGAELEDLAKAQAYLKKLIALRQAASVANIRSSEDSHSLRWAKGTESHAKGTQTPHG